MFMSFALRPVTDSTSVIQQIYEDVSLSTVTVAHVLQRIAGLGN